MFWNLLCRSACLCFPSATIQLFISWFPAFSSTAPHSKASLACTVPWRGQGGQSSGFFSHQPYLVTHITNSHSTYGNINSTCISSTPPKHFAHQHTPSYLMFSSTGPQACFCSSLYQPSPLPCEAQYWELTSGKSPLRAELSLHPLPPVQSATNSKRAVNMTQHTCRRPHHVTKTKAGQPCQV